MRPFAGRGTPATMRPVEFQRLARLEGLAEKGGGGARARDDKHAGRVAVEPVHEPRLAAMPIGEGFKHLVDVARHAGAALHGKPVGLVEDDDVGVLVQDRRFERLAVADLAERRRLRRPCVADGERRNAHRLARGKPRRSVDPRAIDAHLAGADELLQMAEAEAGIVQLEPAVEPHPRLVALDRLCLNIHGSGSAGAQGKD